VGSARVAALFIGPRDEGPIERRAEVVAVAGRGLQGDRYFHSGPESDHDPTREVTLFEAEGVDQRRAASGVDITPEDMRRNIMTEGVRLRELIGKTFWIGDVRLQGLKDNPPCRHLQALAGKPLLQPMIEKGGIRARLLNSGKIATGDPIRIEPSPG
jgi:MOSC domain-containing protein YiiM